MHSKSVMPGNVVYDLMYTVPCLVASVDRDHGRALLIVDHPDCPGRRIWQSLSLLRPYQLRHNVLEPIRLFVADCCRSGPKYWESTAALAPAYRDYCICQGSQPLPWWGGPHAPSVARSLLQMSITPSLRWTGHPGCRRKMRGWSGIELRGHP
jgi:hypothetical protein